MKTLNQCFGWTVAVCLIGALFADPFYASAGFIGLAVLAMAVYAGARIALGRWEGGR